jgi:hypothetical protein
MRHPTRMEHAESIKPNPLVVAATTVRRAVAAARARRPLLRSAAMRDGERCVRAIRGAAAAGSAVLVCALLAAGCGGSSEKTRYLDMAKVRHAIEHSILEQRHLNSQVVCPQNEPQKPHKFACIATTVTRTKPPRTVKTPFLVTVVNDKGKVRYIGLKPPRTAAETP